MHHGVSNIKIGASLSPILTLRPLSPICQVSKIFEMATAVLTGHGDARAASNRHLAQATAAARLPDDYFWFKERERQLAAVEEKRRAKRLEGGGPPALFQ